MKCPYCQKETNSLVNDKGKIKTFVYPIKNDDGTINWKNVFRIDLFSLLLVIGLICMFIGMKQINSQCFEIVENPCKALMDISCINGEQAYIGSTGQEAIVYGNISIQSNLTGSIT